MNQDVVEKAREYIGVPFLHQGRSKEAGVDCIGLCACVAKDLGITEYDYTSYSMFPNEKMMRSHLVKVLEPIPREEMKAGDILYMKFTQEPQHVAILTEKNTIIHSYMKVGKCVEHKLDKAWRKRIVQVFRFRR